MTAAWVSAISEAVTAGAVLAAGITWIIVKINGMISRTAYRAAKAEASDFVQKRSEWMNNSMERVDKLIHREEKTNLAVIGFVTAFIGIVWFHIFKDHKR